MHSPKALQIKKSSAIIIGLILLFIVLFSSFYTAAETNHDCTGEDCPVCASIQHYERTLKQVGSGITAVSSAIIPLIILLISAHLAITSVSHGTPVSNKVRLNN